MDLLKNAKDLETFRQVIEAAKERKHLIGGISPFQVLINEIKTYTENAPDKEVIRLSEFLLSLAIEYEENNP